VTGELERAIAGFIRDHWLLTFLIAVTAATAAKDVGVAICRIFWRA
jgi:hypothetical protein